MNTASPETKLAQLRRIVETKSMGKVDGQFVDLFTASTIVQVHDALNATNRAKLLSCSVQKMADIAYKLVEVRFEAVS